MSLAAVLYPSPTTKGWAEWSWHNYQHHQAIDTAMEQVRGIKPASYRLWPVDEHNFQDWLEQHQQSHSLFTQVLGISGQDLSELDLKDKTKREAWMFQHFIQHQAAAQTLALPIL